MNKIFATTLVALLTLTFATTASADLMVHISGVAGSGTTTWVFSGTEVAGADEDFDSGFLGVFGSVWANHGDLFNSGWTNTDIVPPSGVTITTSFGTRNVDLLYMAEEGAGGAGADPGQDDFGIGVDGSSNLKFNLGETISWTGSFVLNEDLNTMNVGTYSYNYFANLFGTLDMTVTISSSTAVPEPSTLAFVAIAGIGFAYRRRRKSL